MGVTTVKNPSVGPWFNWTETNRAERCITFIESYCRLPQGIGAGKLLRLAPFQKKWIRDNIKTGVKAAIMSIPRGNGKSTFLAAIGLWALFDPDLMWGDPIVDIVAYTLKQTSATYGAAVRMVELEPTLSDRAKIGRGKGNTNIEVRNPLFVGVMAPIAAEYNGLQGMNSTLAIIDEAGQQGVETWVALITGAKKPNFLVAGIGTPGEDDTVLEFLRDQHKKGLLPSDYTFLEYAATPGCRIDDETEWYIANPLLAELESVEDQEHFKDNIRKDLNLPEAYFRILHLGQQVQGTSCWLGIDGKSLWDRLTLPYGFVDGAPTWAGLDVGLHNDTSALVWIQQRPDDRYHAKNKVWDPKLLNGGIVDTEDIENFILELHAKYDLRALVYDPSYFQRESRRLEEAGVVMIAVPQQRRNQMAQFYANLKNMIIKQELTHDGDAIFRTQVLNGEPRAYVNELFTLGKRGNIQENKIDSVVALALATGEAVMEPEPVPEIEYFTGNF